MHKEKFPGLNNMTIDKVYFMARVCREGGCDIEKTMETINCIDNCFAIPRSAVMINRCRGNTRNRVTAKYVIEARIMNADI